MKLHEDRAPELDAPEDNQALMQAARDGLKKIRGGERRKQASTGLSALEVAFENGQGEAAKLLLNELCKSSPTAFSRAETAKLN